MAAKQKHLERGHIVCFLSQGQREQEVGPVKAAWVPLDSIVQRQHVGGFFVGKSWRMPTL